jgi:hypothetical protein
MAVGGRNLGHNAADMPTSGTSSGREASDTRVPEGTLPRDVITSQTLNGASRPIQGVCKGQKGRFQSMKGV